MKPGDLVYYCSDRYWSHTVWVDDRPTHRDVFLDMWAPLIAVSHFDTVSYTRGTDTRWMFYTNTGEFVVMSLDFVHDSTDPF